MLQVRKLFQQLFSFVNVQLFNQLLLRRECCSFSNGEYVKTGLAEVENWIHTAGKEWTGESWDELRYIRQVGCAPFKWTAVLSCAALARCHYAVHQWPAVCSGVWCMHADWAVRYAISLMRRAVLYLFGSLCS